MTIKKGCHDVAAFFVDWKSPVNQSLRAISFSV